MSQWEEGIETEVLKTFSGKRMTEYRDGKKRYEGEFADSFELNYQREGVGEEYDNDGEALIYVGGLKNGKRNGQGKMYKNTRLEYDGEWIMGLKKSHFYTYMALILVFMIVTASACFYYVNGYVGAVVSGVFILAVCFYWNKKAGMLATGLVVIGISYMVNTFVGIFTTGLLAICIVYLIVQHCNWQLNIVYSSAGMILGICKIISLLIVINQNGIMKYLLLLVIGLLLIYITYLIAFFLEWEKNLLYTGIAIIILSCIMSGLIIGLIGKSGLKYVLVFGIGSYIVFIIYVISLISNWEMGIIWISGGVIMGICTFVGLIIGSFEVSFLKYVVIGVIGIGLIVICFVLYWDEDTAIVYTGMTLIIISCIMSGLIIGLIGKSGLKYVFVFGIGSYIVFIIYVISMICKWEMKIVWISGGVILGICAIVGLIIGSFEVSFLKYLATFLIGIELIVLCFFLFADRDTKTVYTGIVLIILSCIMSGLIIGLIGKSGLKYALICGIGSYIVFIIYVKLAIYDGEMEIVWVSGVVLFGICTFVDLGNESETVFLLKHVAIGIIGLVLIVLCFVFYWDENKKIVYTGIVIIIIIVSIISGLIGLFFDVLVFGIGSCIVLMIFINSAYCKEEMENVWIGSFLLLFQCAALSLTKNLIN